MCIRDRQWASEELRADRVVVLTALQYGSEELRADGEVVLAAVNNDGSALQWASEELRADREVVFSAVSTLLEPHNSNTVPASGQPTTSL